MRILCITPMNPYLKTPEITMCEYLVRRGHTVFLAPGLSTDVYNNNYDVVFGAMEVALTSANMIGEKLGLPVYNHMEWIPVFRTNLEPQEEWGYDGTTVPKLADTQIEQFKSLYLSQVNEWDIATVRTTAGKCFDEHFKKFGAKNESDGERLYCADFNKMLQYKKDYKIKNQICTTARLVPHKRIIHIVRALAKITNPPKLVVIGYGIEEQYIKKEATELNVEVEFVGSGKNGVKERVIQESLFGVYPFSGISPAESLYFDKACICYDIPLLKETFKDAVIYAKNNDIDDLKQCIERLLIDKPYRIECIKKGKKMMLNNETRIVSPNKAAEWTEKMLELAIKRYNSYK